MLLFRSVGYRNGTWASWCFSPTFNAKFTCLIYSVKQLLRKSYWPNTPLDVTYAVTKTSDNKEWQFIAF